MEGYGPRSYGEHFADVYDDWYGDVSDVSATVTGVAELAAGRAILELGVGTGRLALPLTAGGADLVGLDASPAMLRQLRAKPGARQIAVVLGDMTDPPFGPGRFGLAFAAFNTFFNLTQPDHQARCAAGVRRCLTPDGAFVIEGFVPPAGGMNVSGLSIDERTDDGLVVTASVHDASTQVIRGNHVELGVRGVRLRPWALHYRTPPQLDELLSRAGFVLEARWADWQRRPFDERSEGHVSVYRAA